MSKENEKTAALGGVTSASGSLAAILATDIPKAQEAHAAARTAGDYPAAFAVRRNVSHVVAAQRDSLSKVGSLTDDPSATHLEKTLAQRANNAVQQGGTPGMSPVTEKDLLGEKYLDFVQRSNNILNPRIAERLVAHKMGNTTVYQDAVLGYSGKMAGSFTAPGEYPDWDNSGATALMSMALKWENVLTSKYGKQASHGLATQAADAVVHGYFLGSDEATRNKSIAGILNLADKLSGGDSDRMEAALFQVNRGLSEALRDTRYSVDPKTKKQIPTPHTGFSARADDDVFPGLVGMLTEVIPSSTSPDLARSMLVKAATSYATKFEDDAGLDGVNPDFRTVWAETAVYNALPVNMRTRMKLSRKAAMYRDAEVASAAERNNMIMRTSTAGDMRAPMLAVVDALGAEAKSLAVQYPDAFRMSTSNHPDDKRPTLDEVIDAYSRLDEKDVDNNLPEEVKNALTGVRSQSLDQEAMFVGAGQGVSLEGGRGLLAAQLSGYTPAHIYKSDQLIDAARKLPEIMGVADSFDNQGNKLPLKDMELPAYNSPAAVVTMIDKIINPGEDGSPSVLGDLGFAAQQKLRDKLGGLRDRLAGYIKPVTEAQAQGRDLVLPGIRERIKADKELQTLNLTLVNARRKIGNGFSQEQYDDVKKDAVDKRNAALSRIVKDWASKLTPDQKQKIKDSDWMRANYEKYSLGMWGRKAARRVFPLYDYAHPAQVIKKHAFVNPIDPLGIQNRIIRATEGGPTLTDRAGEAVKKYVGDKVNKAESAAVGVLKRVPVVDAAMGLGSRVGDWYNGTAVGKAQAWLSDDTPFGSVEDVVTDSLLEAYADADKSDSTTGDPDPYQKERLALSSVVKDPDSTQAQVVAARKRLSTMPRAPAGTGGPGDIKFTEGYLGSMLPSSLFSGLSKKRIRVPPEELKTVTKELFTIVDGIRNDANNAKTALMALQSRAGVPPEVLKQLSDRHGRVLQYKSAESLKGVVIAGLHNIAEAAIKSGAPDKLDIARRATDRADQIGGMTSLQEIQDAVEQFDGATFNRLFNKTLKAYAAKAEITAAMKQRYKNSTTAPAAPVDETNVSK